MSNSFNENEENKHEINVNEIRESIPEKEKLLLRQPKNIELPISDYSWKEFEYISLEIFEKIICNESYVNAFRYGNDGQSQEGLDLITFSPKNERYIVAECKRRKKISPNELKSWVNKFLEGKYGSKTEKYILIVSIKFEAKNLISAWHEMTALLTSKGIKYDLWDSRKISNFLRESHEIVEKFHGRETRDLFCYDIFNDYGGITFESKKIVRSENKLTISNKKIRLDVFLPEKKDPRIYYAINFSRRDINGVAISGDGRFIVNLMQYRSHSSHIKNSPYFYRLNESDRYVFVHPTNRLCLNLEELNDLDWIVEAAWREYITSIETLDLTWKCKRFPKTGKDSFNVILFDVEKWFWNGLVSYAKQHDYENGVSDDFIFYPADYIYLYLPYSRGGIGRGHHISLTARPRDSLSSDRVDIVWEPLRDDRAVYGQKDYWDAEFTHSWIKNYLVPKAYEFFLLECQRKKESENLISKIKRYLGFGSEPSYWKIEDISKSCAIYEEQISDPRDQRGLTSLVYLLQQHFQSYVMKAPIEEYLGENVFESCKMLLIRNPDFDSHYIKVNLNLHSENISNEINKLEYDCKTLPVDLGLKVLFTICQDLSDISDFEIRSTVDLLQPLWKRYNEDKLCQLYC